MSGLQKNSGGSMRCFSSFRVVLLSLSFWWFPAVVLAQAVPATAPIPRVAFPITTAGNVATFGMKTAEAANAANFSFGVAANGSIFASAPDRLPTPGGASIPVTVGGSIPKPQVMAALGRFARKALPVLSTGVALYELGEELGFGLDNSSGSLVVTQQPSDFDGYQYRMRDQPTYPWFYSKYQACIDFGRRAGWAAHYIFYNGQHECQRSPNGSLYRLTFRVPTSPPAAQPSTLEAFESALNARTSWPESSALARVTLDAINSGESLAVQPEAVTGPATSPGPVTQSVNDTAGETTTSTTTNHHTYSGATVTTNVVTVNTTTNNSTGAVINSSTVTQSPVLSPPAPEPAPLEFPCGGPGLPACSVKVDETGTPATVTMADPFPQMQADQAGKLAEIAAADGTAWEPIRELFFLPSATQCVPFEMPVVMGAQVPPIDPCPVVGGIQQVVGVLWYIAGFWIMLGWVREVV